MLVFFFVTVGMAVDLQALTRSWPAACALFFARLLAIRAGYALGTLLAPAAAPPAVLSRTAWLALSTPPARAQATPRPGRVPSPRAAVGRR